MCILVHFLSTGVDKDAMIVFLHQQLLVINLVVKFYLNQNNDRSKNNKLGDQCSSPTFELEFSEDQKPTEVFWRR